jgi:hypothetical protein
VAFEVDGACTTVTVCNCTICTKKAYVHWIVPRDVFRLLRGADQLTTYTFNTGVAQHYFCATCGVAPFYVPRSDPEKIDVNARCLEGVDLASVRVTTYDGQHWEAAYETYRHPT